MQIDIHYYGTYAIARLAGFEQKDANVIATVAQFVDDSTDANSEKNQEGEMLFSIATAHHTPDAGINSFIHPEVHRLVWVPFHFYPGGQGETLEERLLCTKDSKIVNEMFNNHLQMTDKTFYLYLLGIASHVYIDTFAHYGFSGICSDLNLVDANSFEFPDPPQTEKYILDKAAKFFERFGDEAAQYFLAIGAEIGSQGLGHGAVATYPDRPYLTWQFKYENERHGSVDSGVRENKKTYMEGLRKLHKKLSEGACKKYESPNIQNFDEVSEQISKIISLEGKKDERSNAWKEYIVNHIGDSEEEINYAADDEWNSAKDKFHDSSYEDLGEKSFYRFHQAAAYHRWYTLKDLLPKHKVYIT